MIKDVPGGEEYKTLSTTVAVNVPDPLDVGEYLQLPLKIWLSAESLGIVILQILLPSRLTSIVPAGDVV